MAWRKLLTKVRAGELLSYDPATGIVRWKIIRGRATDIAGHIDARTGYRIITIDGVKYRAGRIIWLMMTGKWPRKLIDHINGNKDDNRWHCLREVSSNENSMNRGLDVRNKTGVTGVFVERRPQRRTKFTAYININGRQRRLGSFKTIEAAIACRKAAEAKHYGEFARCTDPGQK